MSWSGFIMAKTDSGREQTEQMFALIGKAITNWSFVEEQLCHTFEICSSLVPTNTDGGLLIVDPVPRSIFFSIENFRGKLNLIDAALNARAAGPLEWAIETRGCWSKVREKARKLSLRRNKLAHWTVLPGYDYKGTIPPRLVPPIGSPGYYRATGLNRENVIPLHNLDHLNNAFYLLQEKLREFNRELVQNEGLFGRYVELMAGQIRSQNHSDQNRAEQIERALSSLE